MKIKQAEYPVDLLSAGKCVVPANGFRWVEGVHGGFNKTAHRTLFLCTAGGRETYQTISPEAYLHFAATLPTESSLLEFAGLHGRLGVGRTHFHLSETDRTMHGGEMIGAWRWERHLFCGCFDIWQLVKKGSSDSDLRSFLESDDYFEQWSPGRGPRVTLSEWVTRLIISTINEKLQRSSFTREACFQPECPRNADHHAHFEVVLPGAEYRLERSPRRKNVAIPRITPGRMISAIWLQFSELVAGSRTLRQCEAPDCRAWMDITDAARKGSKRMHDRCSLRLRMQRYRGRISGAENESGSTPKKC